MLKSLLTFCDRLCAFDHCRVPLPWFIWNTRADPASVLRRRIMEIERGASSARIGPVARFIAAALHLTRMQRELLLCWSRKSAGCQKGFGVSRARQFATLYYTTYRYNFPPSLYYRARLFRLPRHRWLSVFSHGEANTVVPILEQRTEHLDIWSKQGWHRFCARHQLPRVPTLASVSGGQLTVSQDARLDEGRDLFLKPDRGWASRGTVLLEWQPEKSGWQAVGADTRFVPRSGLSAFIVTAAAGADAIVQPRLRTHPDLADLAPRALANVRVVTIRSPDGRLTLFSAALRIPWHAEHCSDVADGFFIPVNPVDGTLGHAEGLDLAPGPLASHPLTGAPIRGRVITQWPEMRAQALAAHALLPSVPAVGWDLVPSDAGVLILEANVAWSTNLTQLRGLAPLGESDWPAAVLACLDAKDPGAPA